MEWFEHEHDDEHEAHGIRAAAGSAEWRVAELFGVEHCRLTCNACRAASAAVSALFSPELGERALMAEDEVIVLSHGPSQLAAEVAACGGIPICLELSDALIEVQKLETLLSFSTRAVVLEHGAVGIENPLTVRNFCNKYDLWLVESVGDTWQKCYEINGKYYAPGAIGDWSVAVQEKACALLTRDDLIGSLLERGLPADTTFGRCADEKKLGHNVWGLEL